jgi:hypothetical protein
MRYSIRIQVRECSQFFLKFVAPISLFSASPASFERSDADRTIYIKGANFEKSANRVYYVCKVYRVFSLFSQCRFPSLPLSVIEVEVAIVLNSTTLTCDAPRPLLPTISTIEISNNNADWTSNANVAVRFTGNSLL